MNKTIHTKQLDITVTDSPRVSLVIGDDYPIQSHLQVFEAHMFMTTTRSEGMQYMIPPLELSVGLAEQRSLRGELQDAQFRKEALSSFNACLRRHIGHTPTKDDVRSFIVCFNDGEDALMYMSVCHSDFRRLASRLAGFGIEFSSKTKRAAAIVPHYYQNNRYPHFHCLYEKTDDDINVMQRFLQGKINNLPVR